MVRQHQLIERRADSLNGLRIGFDDHAGLGFEHARCLKSPLADIAHTNTAHANWSLVLLMTKDRNRNPRNASSIEDSCSVWNGNFRAVDGEGHLLVFVAHDTLPAKQIPAVQW